MPNPDAASLFPLPLTPFEYYYFCDNRPDYPTAFPLELHFKGRLDRDAFQRAWAGSLARQPMLTARVGLTPGDWPAWIEGAETPPAVDWNREGEPIGHPDGPAIDLTSRPGLRAWVREGDGTSRLVLHFHHACCDGLAALQFVEELLVAYHVEIEGPRCGLALGPLEPARLRGRGDLTPPTGLRARWRDLWIGARFWTGLALRRPALLAPARSAPAEAAPALLDFQTVDLGTEQTGGLRRAAAESGTALHDVLLRDLLLSIHEWNLGHGNRDGRPIRVNIPTTLRQREDRWMPAANRLTFAFLARRPRDMAEPGPLLEGIRAEMEAIRRYKLGLYFVGGLGTFCRLPGLVPWFLRRRHSFATAVLTFPGRVLARSPLPRAGGRVVAGNVVLTRIAGVPPIRPLTRAAVAVSIYGGRATVSVRCDPQCFSRDDTLEFAWVYQHRLATTAGGRE